MRQSRAVTISRGASPSPKPAPTNYSPVLLAAVVGIILMALVAEVIILGRPPQPPAATASGKAASEIHDASQVHPYVGTQGGQTSGQAGGQTVAQPSNLPPGVHDASQFHPY